MIVIAQTAVWTTGSLGCRRRGHATLMGPSPHTLCAVKDATMSLPVLIIKLYIPPPGATTIARPRLVKRLGEGLPHKLTVISAPAGSGKTTLVSDWVADCGRPVAWLSLEEADSDPARFLTYL